MRRSKRVKARVASQEKEVSPIKTKQNSEMIATEESDAPLKKKRGRGRPKKQKKSEIESNADAIGDQSGEKVDAVAICTEEEMAQNDGKKVNI